MTPFEVQKEHQWLQKLVGNWTFEIEAVMGHDQPCIKSTGKETVRSFGEFWTLGEGEGETPDGKPANSLMTLGYDPHEKCFVGTFVASVMTHLWIYRGQLNADGNMLTLDTDGPDFSASRKTKYQDIIEFLSDGHRTLTSRIQGADGKWTQFMVAHYRRTK